MKHHIIPNSALNGDWAYYLAVKSFIYLLDNGKCHICRQKITYEKSVLDHIIPYCHYLDTEPGNLNEYWNLRLACRKCNILRSNGKTAGQLRLPILEIIKAGEIIYEMSRM